MQKLKNTHHKKIITVLVLCVCTLFFAVPKEPLKSENFFVLSLQNSIYPVQAIKNKLSKKLDSTWASYINLVDVAKENKTLKKQISDLKKVQIINTEEVKELQQLRLLTQTQKNFTHQSTITDVVEFNRNLNYSYLRIRGGKSRDFKVGMPVVHPNGAIGKIIRVGSLFSDVQTISNINFKTHAMIQRTRQKGIVSVNEHSRMVFSIEEQIPVKIGDTIVSSGEIAGFPKGTPIGQVVKVSYDNSLLSQIIEIKGFVTPETTERVMVIHNRNQNFDLFSELGEK